VARSLGIVKTSIWGDEDFRALRRDEQRAYVLLISQPQINNCGVLPYTLRKWARLALDDDPQILGEALEVLHGTRFIVVDADSDELLVRTFIKHDKIETQPRLLEAAVREFKEIESALIRQTLRESYPQIFASLREPRPLGQGVLEGVPQGVNGGVGQGDNVRARADADAPSPSPKRLRDMGGSSDPELRSRDEVRGLSPEEIMALDISEEPGP
jgi:hypothetical protein